MVWFCANKHGMSFHRIKWKLVAFQPFFNVCQVIVDGLEFRTAHGRSLMYRGNKRGLRHEPCGTTTFILVIDDSTPLSLENSFRLERYDFFVSLLLAAESACPSWLTLVKFFHYLRFTLFLQVVFLCPNSKMNLSLVEIPAGPSQLFKNAESENRWNSGTTEDESRARNCVKWNSWRKYFRWATLCLDVHQEKSTWHGNMLLIMLKVIQILYIKDIFHISFEILCPIVFQFFPEMYAWSPEQIGCPTRPTPL